LLFAKAFYFDESNSLINQIFWFKKVLTIKLLERILVCGISLKIKVF